MIMPYFQWDISLNSCPKLNIYLFFWVFIINQMDCPPINVNARSTQGHVEMGISLKSMAMGDSIEILGKVFSSYFSI